MSKWDEDCLWLLGVDPGVSQFSSVDNQSMAKEMQNDVNKQYVYVLHM